MLSALEQYDPQIYELLNQEAARQSGSIRMIPSENYVSKAVMQATGSCLTNKYAEGYPGKRYYEGQQVTDLIEKLAVQRAKSVFSASSSASVLLSPAGEPNVSSSAPKASSEPNASSESEPMINPPSWVT